MTEGGRTKTTPDKTFQTKNPGQNSQNKNFRELRQTPCKDICMQAMHVLQKIGRGIRDV